MRCTNLFFKDLEVRTLKSSKDLNDLLERNYSMHEQEELIHSAYISARIAELRLSSGLTQATLSRKCGIPQSSLAKIELNDMAPRGDALAKIADALDCKLDLKSANIDDNHPAVQRDEILSQIKKLNKEIEVLTSRINTLYKK